MTRVLLSTTSVCLGLLVAACGSSQGSPTTTGSSGTNAAMGGSTAGPLGGAAPQGGTTSGPTGAGGTTSGPTGTGGTTSGPTGTGGTTGPTSTGGRAAGGAPTGGTTSSPAGGNNAGGSQSTGGKAAGGASVGGASVGGASAGGASAGGASGSATGGSVSTSDKPQVITSADNAFWKTGTYTTTASGTADVTVSDTGSQPWTGFGGCFNEAGWDALSVLTDADRQLAIKLLFDATDGANFANGRIPIGASDYAMSRYTLAETANDTSMASFSITRDRDKLIPFIKAALAVKSNITFAASPWTPPAWMKDNNNTDGGNMKSDDTTLTAFALYLEKFVQEYGKEGITIKAIHPQNEPGYLSSYPSCKWTSDLYIKFIRDFLGPKFKTDLPTTEIWCGTMSAPTDGDIAVALSKDATAMSFVKGFGLQWNTKDKTATLRATGLPVQMTEHKCGNYNFATDYWDTTRYDANKPQNDFAYGVESWKNIRDWVKSGVTSYMAWNMVLDTLGANLNPTKPWHQNALLTVDRTAKTLIRTPAYYVFRHLSQYAAPGSTVVSTTGGDALAFKNGNTYVVVVYNEGAAKNPMTVSVGGAKLQFNMPANGWATLNYTK